MLITFPHKVVHDKKIQAMNVQRDHSFRCQREMHARRERVSGILLKRESLPTIAASITCCLRTKAALCSTWHYTLLL